jgi:hypothetical protein
MLSSHIRTRGIDVTVQHLFRATRSTWIAGPCWDFAPSTSCRRCTTSLRCGRAGHFVPPALDFERQSASSTWRCVLVVRGSSPRFGWYRAAVRFYVLGVPRRLIASANRAENKTRSSLHSWQCDRCSSTCALSSAVSVLFTKKGSRWPTSEHLAVGEIRSLFG